MLGYISANKVKINTKALEEIQRMKATSQFQPCQSQTIALAVTSDSFFTIHCLNISSFLTHENFFTKDFLEMTSQITCLVETWLKFSDVISDTENYAHIRSERNHIHRSGGL